MTRIALTPSILAKNLREFLKELGYYGSWYSSFMIYHMVYYRPFLYYRENDNGKLLSVRCDSILCGDTGLNRYLEAFFISLSDDIAHLTAPKLDALFIPMQTMFGTLNRRSQRIGHYDVRTLSEMFFDKLLSKNYKSVTRVNVTVFLTRREETLICLYRSGDKEAKKYSFSK